MTRDEMESRRMKAVQHFRDGRRQSYVVMRMGVSRMAASRWFRAWKTGNYLKSTKSPGRPGWLSPDQVDRLRELISRDAVSLTTAQMSDFIHARFGIRYHSDHVGKLMRRLGIWKLGVRRVYKRAGVIQ